MPQQVLSASGNALSQKGVTSGVIPPSSLPIIRYAFYAFIFTIPIETLDIGIEHGLVSLSSLIGFLFITVALLQPALTFGELPRPFWYFVAYLFVFVCLGILQIPEHSLFIFVTRLLTIIQMLALFWISFNLFQHQQLIKGALLAFGAGCVLLSILQVGGSAAMAISGGRVSALSQDANSLGSVLGLGLLALLGLAYGRTSQDGRINWALWICSGGLAAGVVLTGSRGALLSLLAGIMCLVVRPGHTTLRLKVGLITVLAVCSLVWAAYENDAVRTRWERTFSETHMSGREEIMPAAWNMFVESPIVGWGPVNNVVELGYRFGRRTLDTHNGYLWVLTETGLAGGVPYLFALWLCLRAAWRARHGPEGSLPLALLTSVFLINMSLTWHYRKMFWIILAYSVASEAFLSKRWRLAYPASSIEKTPQQV
jgi:O-antigen ligase